MRKPKTPPELVFQKHVADFLVREHKYGVLETSDITDAEHSIAEDQLWAFLKATQADTLKKVRYVRAPRWTIWPTFLAIEAGPLRRGTPMAHSGGPFS